MLLPFYPLFWVPLMKQSRRAGEIDAVIRLYDLLLRIIPKLEKFPRSQGTNGVLNVHFLA